MNELSPIIAYPEAAKNLRVALRELGLSLALPTAGDEHIAISSLFSRFYLDSLFVIEITAATPGLGEPNLLVDLPQSAGDDSWGRNQPLFLADDGGLES